MEKCNYCYHKENHMDGKMICQHKPSMEGTEAILEYVECENVNSCAFFKGIVFIVLSVCDMNEYVDYYGDSSGEKEEIQGVFFTLEGACKKKCELEAENENCVSSCDCDSTCYKIVAWKVE